MTNPCSGTDVHAGALVVQALGHDRADRRHARAFQPLLQHVGQPALRGHLEQPLELRRAGGARR